MHDYRPHWTQVAAVLLLSLALAACNRSANTLMTPLPSVPPPTATNAMDEPSLPAVTPVTATATKAIRATVSPEPTNTPQVATATLGSTATDTACGNALPARLRVGSFAYVNPDPPLPNNVRSEAGEASTLLGEIQPGQAMKILDGPTCADGWNWWQVSALDSDQVGWTAEGDEQDYWLIPCASENECQTQ